MGKGVGYFNHGVKATKEVEDQDGGGLHSLGKTWLALHLASTSCARPIAS